jgi:hypothetical protein
LIYIIKFNISFKHGSQPETDQVKGAGIIQEEEKAEGEKREVRKYHERAS